MKVEDYIFKIAKKLNIIDSAEVYITLQSVGVYRLQANGMDLIVKLRKSNIKYLKYLRPARYIYELLGFGFYNEINFYLSNNESKIIPKLYGYNNKLIFLGYIDGIRLESLGEIVKYRSGLLELYNEFSNHSSTVHVKKIRTLIFRFRSIRFSIIILALRKYRYLSIRIIIKLLRIIYQSHSRMYSSGYKLMHSDFHEGNIILSNGEFFLLDFESLRMERNLISLDIVRYYFDYSNLSLDKKSLRKLLLEKGFCTFEVDYIIRISLIRLILPYINKLENFQFLNDILMLNNAYKKWLEQIE